MVMSKTVIDTLLQVTVAEPVAPTAARSAALGPAFDDHLRQLQASSPKPQPSCAADDAKATSRSSTAREAGESNRAESPASTAQPPDADETDETNAGQEPADVDSEPVPTDEDAAADAVADTATDTATDAASPDSDETDDSDTDEGKDNAALVATVQSQIAPTEDEVVAQTDGDGAAETDADGAEPLPATEEAEARSPTRRETAADATANDAVAETVLVATAEEQPTDAIATADKAAVEAAPAATTASLENGDTETKGVEEGQQRRRRGIQPKPEASAKQASEPTANSSPTNVVDAQGETMTVIDKRPARQRAATASNSTSAIANGPTAANKNAAAANVAAAAVAVAAEAAPTSTDDAKSSTGQSVDAVNGRAEGALNSLARFPRGGATGQAGRTAEGRALPQVDAARFVGRVARAFETAQQRGGTLHLRLSPPELGSVKLELTVEHGTLTASLETETNAARQTLLHHLPALRERLAEQNIRIERFDVDVRQDTGGQSSSGFQQQPEETAPNGASVRPPAGRPQVAEEAAPVVTARIDATGINLII